MSMVDVQISCKMLHELLYCLKNVTEEAKKKANKGEFFVNVGDSLCSNCYNFVVQYDRNQKTTRKMITSHLKDI
ncbi:21089_t:CDS:2, partial [Entrophospora sp. SA101]